MPPTPPPRGDGRRSTFNRGPRDPRQRENPGQDRQSNANRRPPRSIAVVELEVTLQSQQAQYVQERALFRVMRSLYTVSVILRHIAAPKDVDEVLKVVFARIAEVRANLEQSHARLSKVLADSGANPKLMFTQPAPVKVQISSPHARRYLELIQFLDKHMDLVERLWLCELLDDAQRHEAQDTATGQVLALAGQINDIETRARDAARRQGKEEIVAEELAEHEAAAGTTVPVEPGTGEPVTAPPTAEPELSETAPPVDAEPPSPEPAKPASVAAEASLGGLAETVEPVAGRTETLAKSAA